MKRNTERSVTAADKSLPRIALFCSLMCLLFFLKALPAEAKNSPVPLPATPLDVLSPIAQKYPPVQSPARPFGLEIVDKVQPSGSDVRSKDFQTNMLPTLTKWSNLDLTAKTFTQTTSAISLDPSKISLATKADVRAYFVSEDTKFSNTLGFNTNGGSITTGDPRLIFPDVSSNNSTRNINFPLLPGDFVNMGTFSSGTQLDFFLIANGANGGKNIYSTDSSINPDGLQHVLAFAVKDSPYLLIGFDDLSSKNRDFKDSLFAVDIGSANVAALASVPEPTLLVILSSFLGLAMYKRRRLHLTDKRKDIP